MMLPAVSTAGVQAPHCPTRACLLWC